MLLAQLTRRLRAFRSSQLGGLAGDSVYVAAWQGSIAAADLAQIAIITYFLGIAEFGRFAVIVALVTLVGAFVEVRVGIAATTYVTRKLRTDPRAAVGGLQLCYLVALASGAVGICIVALVVFAWPSLVGADSTELTLLYAASLILIAPIVPSVTLLRVADRFRLLAGISIVLESCRVGAVMAALFLTDELGYAIGAILTLQLTSAMILVAVAARILHSSTGFRLTESEVSAVSGSERKQLRGTMLDTNIIGYARLAQVQLPTLILGGYAGRVEVGIYKVGIAIAAIVGKIVDPASAALLPRLSRLWEAARYDELRHLIRQISLFTIPLVLIALAGVIAFREPLLRLIGGDVAAEEADTVLILGAVAQALYALAFWRGALLFSAHRTRAVSLVFAATMVVQIAGAFVLIPSLGATGAATALLISQGAIAIALTSLAVLTLRDPERWARRSESPPRSLEAPDVEPAAAPPSGGAP